MHESTTGIVQSSRYHEQTIFVKPTKQKWHAQTLTMTWSINYFLQPKRECQLLQFFIALTWTEVGGITTQAASRSWKTCSLKQNTQCNCNTKRRKKEMDGYPWFWVLRSSSWVKMYNIIKNSTIANECCKIWGVSRLKRQKSCLAGSHLGKSFGDCMLWCGIMTSSQEALSRSKSWRSTNIHGFYASFFFLCCRIGMMSKIYWFAVLPTFISNLNFRIKMMFFLEN